MRLDRLSLGNFRNFAELDIDLGRRFTVVSGPNGAGKTNILEAIYLASTLRSFRTNDRARLIHHHRELARIDLHTRDEALGISSQLGILLQKTSRGAKRTASLDGKTIRSARDFYATFPVIVFTPDDLNILRGSPKGRRQFIDRMIFARDRAHISDIQAYEKLLRARNHVLKRDPTASDELLESYEIGLAEHGANIWIRREQLLGDLREHFQTGFRDIHDVASTSHDAQIAYDSRLARTHPEYLDGLDTARLDHATVRQLLVRALGDGRARDRLRRTTGRGPHLDDLKIELDGHDASEHASQGQCRALMLAAKIAELRSWSGDPPLFLLDDVSSELDPQRNARLFELLVRRVRQCVITTTAPEFIRLDDVRVDIRIRDGRRQSD